jgi:hypothetical protein
MRATKTKILQMAVVGTLFLLLVVFAISHSSSNKTSAKQSATTTTTTETHRSISDATINLPTTTVNTQPSDLFNTDDVSPSEMQASFDSKPQIFDPTTTSYLKQLANAVVKAQQVGIGRENFPAIWPDLSQALDPVFKTVQIDAVGVVAGDASNATIEVYWQSADLDSTNYPQLAVAKAQLVNGAWQVINVQV